MFKGMGEADLTSLENFSRLKSLQAGQHVFKEADAGDGFYFIIRGRIQISARFGDNQRRVFATFGPGEFFGEMAVLDDAPRSADAIADEASEVYFIPRENLAEILERNPKLAMRMLRDFSRRLREFDRKYIEEALQVERMGKMVTEFLEFTRGDKTTSNVIETDYAQFVNEIIDELRPELTARSVAIELATPLPRATVLIDPTRLVHVFYNLVGNACDAMTGGGKIQIRLARKHPEVVTEIEDGGKGIPPQMAQRLFEPFATYGKAGGTGLGLSICKRVIEDHHGRIEVRSEPGHGAIFLFTLPLVASTE